MISEEIHHSTTNEYCIIFGNSLQAEHLFLAGCYFYTLFYIHFHKGVIPYAKHRIIHRK